MLLRQSIAALWSPAGKGLTPWLSFVMFNCVFVTFPFGILCQVWYFIVSIPELCQLSYFKETRSVTMNIFRKKYFLFKSFVKIEFSYVFTIKMFSTAENCMEK